MAGKAKFDQEAAFKSIIVAEAVEYVLTQREGIVIPELVLRPQFHRIRKKK